MTLPLAPAARKVLSARRVLLLAGTVAGVGALVLLGSPSERSVEFRTSAALAADTVRPQAGFGDLIERVKPAVISVRVKIEENAKPASMNDGRIPMQPGSPFERFFRDFGFPENSMPNTPGRRHMMTGEGSGFFISADGYAVTNYHVVNGAKSVEVKTDDGKTFTAKVVGSDEKTDLALIKIDDRKDFPFVTFAENAPRIGDWVVAVGNPYGLNGSATAGIVSARGRDIGSGPYDDFIQIDASINKGNSGGPTFNADGKVIGVNTAIYSPSGGSIGIGFTIPSETVKSVVAQLKDKGYVSRGWIGVKVQTVTPGIADSLGMKTAAGALVDEPQSGSPAVKAGILSGDVITAVDGAPLKDARDLARKISMMGSGRAVKLSVLRKGEDKSLTVTLGNMPDERQAKAADQDGNGKDMPRLGMTLAPAKDVGGAGSKGVAVVSVEPDSTAAERGMRSGDVILDVAGKPVSDVAEVRKALSDARAEGKKNVLLRVMSEDQTRFVAVPVKA
jgi:serine protease Do